MDTREQVLDFKGKAKTGYKIVFKINMENFIVFILLMVILGMLGWKSYKAVSQSAKGTKQPSQSTGSAALNWSKHDSELHKKWKSLLADDTTLILDTETTGLYGDPEVIEVGVVDVKGNVVFEALNLPQGSISMDATKLHGLTKVRIKKLGYRPWSDIQKDLVDHLKHATTVVSYNASFDEKMLKITSSMNGERFPSLPWYDAMKAYAGEAEYIKLKEAADWEGVNIETTHRTTPDARLLLSLMKKTVERIEMGKPTPDNLIKHRKKDREVNRESQAATERQINYIKNLLEERDIPDQIKGKIKDDLNSGSLTKTKATETLDELLKYDRPYP